LKKQSQLTDFSRKLEIEILRLRLRMKALIARFIEYI
jgi:hypothetical protein